jgi:excisionase family DNA binding protein
MNKLSIGNSTQELLNVHEAASFLTVSVTTIRRWAQSGKITGVKIGIRGDWRFTKDDLLQMVKPNNKKVIYVKSN